MNKFIHIRSARFPILPGEKEKLVHEGMYGKALAEYLQARLRERGYDAPFICCEDWGWGGELRAPFTFGVCIYCGPEREGPLDLYCTDGATARKKWSWRGLRFVDTTPYVTQLHNDLVSIFRAEPDVQVLATELDSRSKITRANLKKCWHTSRFDIWWVDGFIDCQILRLGSCR